MLKRTLFIFVLSYGILLSPSTGYESEFVDECSSNGEGTCSSPVSGGQQASELAEKVQLVRLYSISDGKLSHLIYRNQDLRGCSGLTVNGYVCGIVVLCEEDMAVDLDGQELSKIRMNADGTYSLQYFGTFRPEDLELPDPDKAYYKKTSEMNSSAEEHFLSGGYSFFPRLMGNTICPQDQFNLNFTSGGKTYVIPVQQNSVSHVDTVSLDSDRVNDDLTFRYIGDNLEGMRKNSSQYKARLQAITEGIDYVEATFGLDLVNGVNIIDFEDVYNAISCDGENNIWFYIRTFREEPLSELKTIAAHETLHVFVDQMQFALDPAVREYFADLKGYSELSYERFILMVAGNAITGEAEAANNLFFNFINEKNFIEDMKGGHAQKNLEEFCTSFLHSLIFIDRLESNLDKPLKISGTSTGLKRLSPWEKQAVVDQYIGGIECLLGAFVNSGAAASPDSFKIERFLQAGLEKARMIRAERSGMTSY
jgi:hypothetical protein